MPEFKPTRRLDHRPRARLRRLSRLVLPTLALLGAMLLGSGCQSPGVDVPRLDAHTWRKVSTAHFTLVSDETENASVQLALDLERFRALVLRISGARLAPEPIPTKIYLFSDWGSYFAYTNGRNMLGFTYPTLRTNYLVISPGVYKANRTRIIFHEYVHYLLRHQRIRFPTWYDEGLAEFMSDVRVRDGIAHVGNIPREGINAYALYWRVPLQALMADDFVLDWPPSRIASFYGQSWATVSYLMSSPARRGQLQAYLEQLNNGATRSSAFQAAFGTDAPVLTREIRRHLHRRRLPGIAVPLAELEYPTHVTHTVLAPHQVASDLGELTLLVGRQRAVLAQRLFEMTLAHAPDDAPARSGLAIALAQQQRYADAISEAQRAVNTVPDSPQAHLDLAKILFGMCAAGDALAPQASCRPLLDAARGHFERSMQLSPEAPEAHAGMGLALARLGEERTRAIEHLNFAYDLSQWLPQLSLELAKLYLADGREAQARQSLLHVIRWSRSDLQRREAEDLLARLAAPAS